MTRRIAVLLGLAALASATAGAQSAAPVVDNFYSAGETVKLPAPVVGDALLAGRIVDIGQPVSGDILAAGWRVTISAHADDDVRAAGAEVLITAPVGGDLTAAAGDLTVGPNVLVGGRTWLSGRTLRVDGVFEREVRIAAEHVQIGGEIRQPIRVVAQRLDILPSARVLAPLTYEGATPPTIASGAVLTQAYTYRNIPEQDVRAARWPRGISSLVFGIHLFVGGALLLLLVPRLARKPAAVLGDRPAQSLLIGLALLVTVPFVAILLMLSIIALPVGLALVSVYLAALFFGLLTTAIFVGNLEARLLKWTPAATTSRQILLLLAGVVTLAVLRSIPVLGTFVVLLAVAIGLGALGVWTYRTYTHAAVAAA